MEAADLTNGRRDLSVTPSYLCYCVVPAASVGCTFHRSTAPAFRVYEAEKEGTCFMPMVGAIGWARLP